MSDYNFNRRAGTLNFVLAFGEVAEAIMQLRVGHVVRCDSGHRDPLVYVAFLEVAPWDQAFAAADRRFSGLGPIMMRLACDLSVQRGFSGRLGLHSVAAAEDFYRHLGFESHDCPSEFHELYMELDDTAAEALLRGGG